MKNYVKSYKKLNFIVKLIIEIIPVSAVVNAICYRIATKNYLGAVLSLVLLPIFWIVDLITVIFTGKIILLA